MEFFDSPAFDKAEDVEDTINPIPESSEVDATEVADIPELLFIVAVEDELMVDVVDNKNDFLDDGDNDFVLDFMMSKIGLSPSLTSSSLTSWSSSHHFYGS